jgi:ribosome-associated protein
MDISQLQRAIITALDNVKAQDLAVFDTSHLSSLFERVILACGTSNRHTRSLAMAVRDEVKSLGGQVISVEGLKTGEWVLVDCNAIIVHIMQPIARNYYCLEQLWGDVPVEISSCPSTEDL